MKSVDKELQRLKEYKEALDVASIVAITDLQGKITYANGRFCQISQYSFEELIGQTHKVVNSGYHSKDFWQKMWRTIAQGEVWQGRIRNQAKDGSFYWVETSIVPLLGTTGKPEQYLAIRTDITEKILLEEQVMKQERLASIGVLASGLASEVGTPLEIIRNRTEKLALKIGPNSSEAGELQVITNQINRISELVQSLLQLGKGFGGVEFKRLALNKIIKEIIVLVKQSFSDENIELEIKLGNDIGVKADPDQIQQIILNLLVNALQAVKEAKNQGKSGKHKVSLIADVEHTSVVIRISDTGLGIPEENHFLIFQPFFTTKEVGQGTGLGLSIVYRILEGMNGEISVEGNKEGGATFVITVPVA